MADLNYSTLYPQSFLNQLLFGATLGESPADMALNRGGSIMGSAKANPREAEARQDPLVATLGRILNAANPVNWMGGVGGSSTTVIPSSFEMANLLKALAKRAPKLVAAAKESPRQIVTHMTAADPMGSHPGIYQKLDDLTGIVQVSGAQPRREQLRTLAHELQHSIYQPPARRPEHLTETSQQIAALLPHQQQGELLGILGELRNPSTAISSRTRTAADVHNEATAYLVESLLYPARSADPALQAVAAALGMGIK